MQADCDELTMPKDQHIASDQLNSRLQRLESLCGTDEGFFVLALHSFVENFVNEYHPPLRYESRFDERLWQFGELLKQRHGIPHDSVRVLIRIGKEHKLTNRVRHDFRQLDAEEAAAAIHNFLGFCKLCRIDSKALDKFRERLKLWDEKVSPLERSRQLESVKLQLVLAQRRNTELVQQMEGHAEQKQRVNELNLEIRRLSIELEQERLRASGKTERVDNLRQELNGLRLQKQDLLQALERYQNLEEYVEYLDRFTLYTRTRLDYERTVMKLTPEQQEIIGAIDLSHDFLIKGGAGTGKTLVLLYALDRARREAAEELDLEPARKIILLTYTNTLVKYDRYLAEIMGSSQVEQLVQTADSFLLSRLRSVDSRYRVDYGIMDQLCRQLNSLEFLSCEELDTEIEDLIFANNISREEYVDQRVARRGMRQPLSAAQRTQVWSLVQRFIEEMERKGTLSKNYSRIKLVEALEAKSPNQSQDIDYIFVDESQDLTAVDLKALKLLAERAVVMAGDVDQSIYGVGSPYKRAGIDIVGRTRILKTNFRNTCPIHDIAEFYRMAAGAGSFDEANVPKAFREGPVPELYQADTERELQELLLNRVVLFTDRLGYDPENITILAPTKIQIEALSGSLRGRGFEVANIRDDEFSFRQEKVIRLSTLHSSKGLDFAVVLLYLPGLSRSSQYDEPAADKLLRNLIYVAMTRAMDNLNVFLLSQPVEPALRDLVQVFGEYQERQESAAGGLQKDHKSPEGMAEEQAEQ